MRTIEEINSIIDRLEPIIAEYDGAKDRFDRGQWTNKFGEQFKPYEDKLKKLNGDDFDIMKESYDEYHKDYSNLSDDDYANSLEENIKKVLQRIWPEAEPEQIEQAAAEVAESAADDGEAKAEAEVEIETKAKPKAEPEAEPEAEVKVDGDDDITSDEACKKRYAARSASNKKKLAGWDPQKGLLRSDEECKEEVEEPSAEESFIKELEDYKANMPKRK